MPATINFTDYAGQINLQHNKDNLKTFLQHIEVKQNDKKKGLVG